MPSRFANRSIELNSHSSYNEQFKNRNVSFIHQYATAKLKYPSTEEITELTIIGHIWHTGDRFYKLAHEFYGDPRLWWVLAWYNQTPLESHVKLGDIVDIPMPLQRVLRMLEV